METFLFMVELVIVFHSLLFTFRFYLTYSNANDANLEKLKREKLPDVVFSFISKLDFLLRISKLKTNFSYFELLG